MREAKVSFGYTWCDKSGHIPGGPIHVMTWLPKGYGPTEEDRLLAVFFDTDGRWGGIGKELPPLLRVVKKAVEDYLRDHPEEVAGHLTSKDW